MTWVFGHRSQYSCSYFYVRIFNFPELAKADFSPARKKHEIYLYEVSKTIFGINFRDQSSRERQQSILNDRNDNQSVCILKSA
jgi:hypothetical protein